MDLLLHPRALSGDLTILPSKSLAHRYLILAALALGETTILCPQTSRDMEATAACLNALGAGITRTEEGFHVRPIDRLPEKAELPCRDSGSTLRFLLPVVGALGVEGTFRLEGRLAQRPLSPLWEEMNRMGCFLDRPDPSAVRCRGRLRAGEYHLDGSVSSQFLTGLMLALPLIPGHATLIVLGEPASRPYLDLTREALDRFGGGPYRSPGKISVEGDWSNAAFFLAANALGSSIRLHGLQDSSRQGDRCVTRLLPALTQGTPTISAWDIPDLIPILAVTAAACHGAVFTHIHRLRWKESDRVAAIVDMIQGLGGSAQADGDTLRIGGTGLTGGTVDGRNDHRIVMAAAIASTLCREPVIIQCAQATEKSYPQFWQDFAALGGNYEQYLR